MSLPWNQQSTYIMQRHSVKQTTLSAFQDPLNSWNPLALPAHVPRYRYKPLPAARRETTRSPAPRWRRSTLPWRRRYDTTRPRPTRRFDWGNPYGRRLPGY